MTSLPRRGPVRRTRPVARPLARVLSSGAVAGLLVAALAGCGGGSDSETAGESPSTGSSDSTTSASGPDLGLVEDGTLTVCSDVPYPPFEDFDTSSPSGFTGFDIDLVQEIANGLGLDLSVQDSSFDALQSGQALSAGQCDLAASAMTITPDREKNLAFSQGYYDSQQSLLVSVDSDITGIGDLDGVKVGVQQGTTGKTYAEDNATGAEIVTFPSDAEMFQAIQAGQVDALLQDLPVNLDHTSGGKFDVVETYATDEQYGFAMAKDATALVAAVDEQLQALRDDGTYDTIYNSYFSTE